MPDTNRPSRIYVLSVYIKRILRWRRDSSPYLSGDAFAEIADVVIGGPKWRVKNPTPAEISGAKIIYCRSDLLQNFLDTVQVQINAKIIIAGNSDHEFHKQLDNVPDSVSTLFLQNSFISDNKRIFTLPIGIENFRFGVNGHPRLMRSNLKLSSKRRIILFGPFSNTHPLRLEILKRFSLAEGPWEILKGRWSPRNYAKVSRDFKWVASVRGNGIDTHRLWETLYRGSIPVVFHDNWSDSLSYLGLPIILVESWEPKAAREIVLNDLYKTVSSPKQFEALWMPYWRDLIQKKIEE
jgi:hypothetical protein